MRFDNPREGAPWSDSTGTALVRPDGSVFRAPDIAGAGRTMLWDYARNGVTGVSASAASCTFEASTFDGEACLKVTGTSTATVNLDIDVSATPIAFGGGVGMDIVSDRTKGTTLALLAAADTGFAAYIQGGANPTAASNTAVWTYRTVQPYTFHIFPTGSDPAFSPGYQGTWAGTPPTYPTELSKVRVRAINVGGQVPVFYLRRVYAVAPRISRVVISIDDGYATAYRLLKPVLDTYALRASWGIIYSAIGATATFMTTHDLGRLYDQGHELVAHGPTGGSGSLTSNYATAAEAVADAEYNRDGLRSLGVLRPEAASVYVWPGGSHQWATDDTTLRDAMRSAGFTVGRGAAPLLYPMCADTWPERLLLPIVGHTQAASSGAEATNIAAVVSAIDNAALWGTDVIVMLHAGVPSTDTNWGSNGTLNIRTTDLATICSAIRENVDAGTQRSVLLSDLQFPA